MTIFPPSFPYALPISDGGFHVYAVLGNDGDTVVAYNPWEQKLHEGTTDALGANQDWLILGLL